MNGIDISFIVPVYNVEGYVARCLDGLVAQCGGTWEAIVVDDGSFDGGGGKSAPCTPKDTPT